jgi:hypothetical protein
MSESGIMKKGSMIAVFWVKICVIILLSGDSASMLSTAFSPSLVHPTAIQNRWSAAKRPRLMQPFPRPCLCMKMTDDSGGLSDADIAGLLARVSATKGRVATIPICILDATLPRQRLEFAADDPSFSAMLQYCKEMAGGEGLGKFGMLGKLPYIRDVLMNQIFERFRRICKIRLLFAHC